ncbi:MAG: SRPBCC family protein [Vicinamibacterales bacterium]
MAYTSTHTTTSDSRTGALSLGLGWFSLALGTAELVAPSHVARLIGVPDDERTRHTLRTFGAREIAAGVAILAQPGQARWLWSRVGGDALDLAWLGRQMDGDAAAARRVGMAAAAVAGVTALDVMTARRLAQGASPTTRRERAVRVEQVVTINRSADDLYRYWRDFTNFPRVMKHVTRVEQLDSRRSRWTASAPAGMSVSWDAEIVQDREGEWLAWRSLPDSQVENSGSVRFTPAPGARGTEVRVQLEYAPPAGRFGRAVAMLFGEEPEQQVRDDLRRFKQLMETGEIPLSDGPGLWRAAQPARHAEQIREHAGVSR